MHYCGCNTESDSYVITSHWLIHLFTFIRLASQMLMHACASDPKSIHGLMGSSYVYKPMADSVHCGFEQGYSPMKQVFSALEAIHEHKETATPR